MLITLLSQEIVLIQEDLGPFVYYLGVEVVPHEHGLLSQYRYIKDLLTHNKMIDAKAVVTALPSNSTVMPFFRFALTNPACWESTPLIIYIT